MAKKLPLNKNHPPKKADDLDILHPERVLTIGDKTITVREYGFTEGLRLRPLARPFTDGLYQLLATGSDITYQTVLDVVADNLDVVLQLIAMAADVSVDYIESLPQDAGDDLMMAWWGANGPFFVKAAVHRLQIEAAEKALVLAAVRKAEDGVTFTKPSSAQDTTTTE